MKNISIQLTAIAMAITLAISANFASAQYRRVDTASEASALSALPVASVLIVGVAASAASAAAAASVALPVALATSGVVLVIKAVEVTARGTLCVLERASDGAQVSVEIAARGVQQSAFVMGKTVQVSVIGAGAVLSLAGEVIAFVPNEIGRALLHNERITH